MVKSSEQTEGKVPGLIRLVTRGSALALKQAELVKCRILELYPSREVTILIRKTSGDQQQDWVLREQGGRGLFTKELEEALLDNDADIAVHSAKDLPTLLPDGLALATCLSREIPTDTIVFKNNIPLPRKLASGSPRRQTQGALLFPKATWSEIRGNVETRLKKIASGEADGTFLATAGLRRLGISSFPGLTFKEIPIEEMVPAVGQAAIALQVRNEDQKTYSNLGHSETFRAIKLERFFLRKMGGGCHVPYAGHCSEEGRFYAFHPKYGMNRFSIDFKKDSTGELTLKQHLKTWFPRK